MKKTIILLAVAMLPTAVGCGVKFYPSSTQTWVVGDQTWSAPIEIPACNKEDFSGGSYIDEEVYVFEADCRNNPGYSGYLYSWYYVSENAAALCPSPWRVPTKDDFVNLDKAFGGTGETHIYTEVDDLYFVMWGGSYGGYAKRSLLIGQGSYGYCWSSTEYDSGSGSNLSYDSRYVRPQDNYYKYNGLHVRCVK